MNKKANYADIPEYIYIAFVVVISAVFTLIFIGQFVGQVNSQPTNVIPDEAKTGANALYNSLPAAYDWLFIAVYLLFVIFSVTAARLIPSSPVFIFITIFAVLILPFVAMILSNVWDGFATQVTILNELNNMPITKFFMNNLVYFVLFYSLAVGAALLTKEDLTT